MSLASRYLQANRAIWNRLPRRLRDTRALRWYGSVLQEIVRRRAQRQQCLGTFFMRNRPQLEQIRRLVAARPRGAELRLAILGCSIGAEVYSVLWTIRSARQDLEIRTSAVDISPSVLAVAERAAYTSESSGMVRASIFERLSPEERKAMFDWDGERATVKPWIRAGISWHLGDVSDPRIARTLGPQDIVLASNFLCHMEPETAELCLRNIARLVKSGGHLLVVGIDLDVRAKVACELRWHPLPELIREVHDGDPSVRGDWPWAWWGLEPLDDRRGDWRLRYAAAFRLD